MLEQQRFWKSTSFRVAYYTSSRADFCSMNSAAKPISETVLATETVSLRPKSRGWGLNCGYFWAKQINQNFSWLASQHKSPACTVICAFLEGNGDKSATEWLNEWTRSYPVVLVGCDCCESGLLENKRLIVFLCVFLTVLAWVDVDDVKPGLISVHGVQDDLQEGRGKKGGGGGVRLQIQ